MGKKSIWVKLIVITILGISLFGRANTVGLKIGPVSYGGTGCPRQKVQIDSNENELGTIFLKSFKQTTQKSMVRKNCQLTIPIFVENKIQVGIGPIHQISGKIHLPHGNSKFLIKQEVFISGTRGKVLNSSFKGINSGPLKVQNANSLKDLQWSPCGKSFNLRVSLTGILTSDKNQMAMASIEEINLLKTNHFYWRVCR
jgi:hypothetical protein